MQLPSPIGNKRKDRGVNTDNTVDELPAAASDTGCERTLNEDRYSVIESPSGSAWIVCDGMGGATGGELAAHVAIEAMRRDLEGMPARSPEVALRSAILEGNRVIVLRRQNPVFANMGTTVVACLFSGPELVIGNVGDSRAYLVEGKIAAQLSIDHTYVQQLVERGELDAADALSHPQAHVLTRALGAEPGVKVDTDHFWIHEAAPGSEEASVVRKILLCSDGLYSLVSDAEIAEIVSAGAPQDACVELIELARKRGGYDNITVAVIPIAGPVRREPPPGYEKRRRDVLEARARDLSGSSDRFAVFATSGVLGFMAIAVTLLLMLYRLSR